MVKHFRKMFCFVEPFFYKYSYIFCYPSVLLELFYQINLHVIKYRINHIENNKQGLVTRVQRVGDNGRYIMVDRNNPAFPFRAPAQSIVPQLNRTRIW